jgi:hypothetical protein
VQTGCASTRPHDEIDSLDVCSQCPDVDACASKLSLEGPPNLAVDILSSLALSPNPSAMTHAMLRRKHTTLRYAFSTIAMLVLSVPLKSLLLSTIWTDTLHINVVEFWITRRMLCLLRRGMYYRDDKKTVVELPLLRACTRPRRSSKSVLNTTYPVLTSLENKRQPTSFIVVLPEGWVSTA